MALKVQVNWTDGDGITQVLDDFTKITARKGADISHNTLDIGLKNPSGGSQTYISSDRIIQFNPEQQIDVYARFDNDGAGLVISNTNLVFSGRVVEFKCKTEEATAPITLKCSDSTYIAMNKLWVGDESGTPPQLIEKIISFINHGLPTAKKVTATLSATLPTPNGRIASVKNNASAFAQAKLAKVFKPAYEAINDLSQPSVTGELVPYRFHVNRNNEFTWFYPSDAAKHVLTEGVQIPQTKTYVHPITRSSTVVTDAVGHNIKSVDMTYAVYDVVNFIIYKAGSSLDNSQILDFSYDATSGAPTTKDSFRNWEDIARTIKLSEKNVGNLTHVKEDEYTVAVSSGTTSWGQAYSSAADYKTKFIAVCKLLASARAQAEFRKTGNPRWKGTIEVRGENSFDANDTCIFSSSRHGIQNVFMRITELQHSITKSGWFCTLTLDEETTRN